MYLNKIQYLDKKDRFFLEKVKDGENCVRAIATKHKHYLPMDLYKTLHKLEKLELIESSKGYVHEISITHEGLEVLHFLELTGELA